MILNQNVQGKGATLLQFWVPSHVSQAVHPVGTSDPNDCSQGAFSLCLQPKQSVSTEVTSRPSQKSSDSVRCVQQNADCLLNCAVNLLSLELGNSSLWLKIDAQGTDLGILNALSVGRTTSS